MFKKERLLQEVQEKRQSLQKVSETIKVVAFVVVLLSLSSRSLHAQLIQSYKPSACMFSASFDEQDLFVNSALSWGHPNNFESQISFGLGFRRTFFSGLPLPKMDYQFKYNWAVAKRVTLQPFLRYYFSSIALNYFGGRRTYYHGFSPGVQCLFGSKNQIVIGASAGPSEYWEHHFPAHKGRFIGYNLMLGYRIQLQKQDD